MNDAQQDEEPVQPAAFPTAARVAIGLVLGGLTLTAIGLLVLPSLMFPEDRPAGRTVVATDSTAQEIAEDLDFSMSDQKIADTVAFTGSTVVELSREPGRTTVLVAIIPYVTEPTTPTCYQFVLTADDGGAVTHEKTGGCPVSPSQR
ncbi:MAG: hypothetical protein GEV28_20370 [Actinophytocola sp.]|uniref:hypothetical protein n=1 Tax=Actinophytocola sp. TaxID=1872138 RepID=UPI0013219DE3|nr:hypothetical protein [Actinophytocola sp.]MPZ82622.1 hypothetical protein [Actinophytocola sp.]